MLCVYQTGPSYQLSKIPGPLLYFLLTLGAIESSGIIKPQGSQASPFVWILGMELRPLDLAASTFACYTISAAPGY